MDTPIGLEVKAEFLYNIYQDWEDGLDYKEEIISRTIKQQDLTRAICVLYVSELIDLSDNEDYAYFIEKAFDQLMPLINERNGNDNV